MKYLGYLALLFLSLYALPCSAQMKGNVPSMGLYTKVECEAKGGSWKVAGMEPEEKCYFASVDACLRNGGFEDRDRRSPRVRCNFLLAQMRDKCMAEGGTFQPGGLAQSWGCVLPTKDGGKPCIRKSDCEIACLYVLVRRKEQRSLVSAPPIAVTLAAKRLWKTGAFYRVPALISRLTSSCCGRARNAVQIFTAVQPTA